MLRMHRALLVSALVMAAFGVTAACGTPTGTSPTTPVLTEAQATDVRRTAVAEVQRIIANNPTVTPLPSSTATPLPTCQGAIWWNEARTHVGEQRTVQGTVVASRLATDGSALLEIGQPYPDPIGLAVIAPASAANILNGKTVCIAGRITIAEGRPTLQVRDASTIVVVD
jgi:hypothetical protein